MRMKTGDTVEVITGKSKKTRGKIEKVIFGEDGKVAKAIVTGVNIVKKHQKKSNNRPGGIIEKPAALDISNVMLVCPNCNLKARVGVGVTDGKKYRLCKKCGKRIDK